MADTIDNIVSQEVFSQLKALSDSINQCDDALKNCIVSANEMSKSLSSATGLRDVSKLYQENVERVNALGQAQNRYVNTINDVKKAASQLSGGIDELARAHADAQVALNKMGIQTDIAAKSMVGMQKQAKEIATEIKYLNKKYDAGLISVTSYKKALAELKVEEAELKAGAAENAAVMKKTVAESNAAEGSYNRIKARIDLLTNAMKQMSDEELKNENAGGVMRKELVILKDRLSELNAEMGNDKAPKFRTMIMAAKNEMMTLGQSIKSLNEDLDVQRQKSEEIARSKGVESEEYRNSVEAIKQGEAALAEMSEQYTQLQENAASLIIQQKEVNKQMAALSDPTANIKAMTGQIGLVAHSFTLMKAAAHAAGIENEAVEKTMAKIYIVQQSLNAINAIAMTLNKNSLVMVKTRAAWEKIQATYKAALVKSTVAETAATQANTTAQVKNTAATAGATAATGALAAGETAATATSFTLVGALKAVSVAIKSIPIIGWILAAISALIALGKLVASFFSESEDGNESRAKAVELEIQHQEEMSKVNRAIEQENEQLEKALKTLKEMNSSATEYRESIDMLSNATGLTKEYLEEHKDELDEITKKAEELQAAEKKKSSAEKEYNDLLLKQTNIRNKISNINSMDHKNRKEALEQMYESGELLESQYKAINKAMHDSRDEHWETYEYEEKINEILNSNVETSENYLATKKEALEVANKSYETAKNEINELKDSMLYESAKKELKKRIGEAEIARIKAEAQVSKDSRKKKEADLKAEKAAYKKLREERREAYEEMIAGMNKESEEYAKLKELRVKEMKEMYSEYLAKVKLIEQNYAKEARQRAKERADNESDIRIAEYDYMLGVVTGMEDKQRYYTLKAEEELAKKKRAINSNEALTKKQKIAMIEQAERDSAKKIADNYKQMVDKQIDYAIKLAKDLSSAVANVDTQKLKEIQQSMKYESDPEELKRKKQSEIDLMVEMEEKKHQQILAQNWEARDKEEADFQGGEEEWMKLVEKWNAIETAEELRHSNELVAINQKNIENKRKALDTAIKKLEEDFKDRQNNLVIENVGELTEGQKMREQMNLVQQQIDKWNELHDAYIEDGMSEEEWQRKHAEMLAKQVVLEEEYAQRRKDALVDLGGAMFGLGDALADMVDDEVQQTKIKQALAVAEVLMNQGIAISEAVKEGMNGDTYTAALRIMTSMSIIATSIMSAMNAVRQSEQSIQQAENYAEGTDYHHGGAAVIGEAGYPELVLSNGKSFVVDAPTFFPNLPIGSKVIPLNGSAGTDLSEVIEGIDRLNRKETVLVNVGKDVYTYIWNGASRTRILNKKFCH